MRRGFVIVAVVLLILAGIGIGVGSYNAGVDEGIARQLVESSEDVQVIRVVGEGHRGGFFPFGLLFFPLFLFGVFALVRAATWRGRWGGPGPWGTPREAGKEHARERFDEWHRTQHEQGDAARSAGGEPA